MKQSCRLAWAFLFSITVGCTSAPVRYYTLTPSSDDGSTSADTHIAIEVRVRHIPSQLDHAELLVRTGPTGIALLENERWASPLRDEIKDALRDNLQRRVSRVNGLDPAISKLTLEVDVQRFEAQLGRHAILEASWQLLTPPDRAAAAGRAGACEFRRVATIAPGYAGIVQGFQQDIAALADAIVAEVTSRTSGGAACLQASASSNSATRG